MDRQEEHVTAEQQGDCRAARRQRCERARSNARAGGVFSSFVRSLLKLSSCPSTDRLIKVWSSISRFGSQMRRE